MSNSTLPASSPAQSSIVQVSVTSTSPVVVPASSAGSPTAVVQSSAGTPVATVIETIQPSTTSTRLFTTLVTQPANTDGGNTNGGGAGTTGRGDTTVIRTTTRDGTVLITTRTDANGGTATGAAASSSSAATAIANGGTVASSSSGGLSTGATTAIAVVIPVAFIALLIGLGLFFWRRRKQKKVEEEERRKEVEEYHYNPNGDPTLPAVGSEAGGAAAVMSEDHNSGYRGWGAATLSNRKASTTLSAGHTQHLSESGTMYKDPQSPGYSDGHSGEPLYANKRDTMNSDDLGALGVGPAATFGRGGNSGLQRGPSNASSAYSAGERSEGSDEPPPLPAAPGPMYSYGSSQGYGYGQHGPYGDGSYGGNQDGAMPVVRDLNARRNTHIQPGGAYQQGNSGIAQNF